MSRPVRFSWPAGIAAVLFSPAFAAQAAGPDLAIGEKQYPQADAVILRWEQHWTLDPDGSVHHLEHQWVKLLNRRPISRYADRTIDYHAGEDELVVHAARAHLPNGEVLPVPDYGINLGAAAAVAGWPAYTAWQQRIVSFSGVQPGATLELDYEITTRGGVLPCLSAEVRLDGEDPVHERIISVTLPADMTLHHQVDNIGKADASALGGLPQVKGETQIYTWRLGPVAGARDEALAPPWQQRSPRLRFSTVDDAVVWVRNWTDAVARSATPDAAIEKFVEDAVKDATGARARLDALLKAFGERFNYISASPSWRSHSCRSASDVFAANYGNPLEAAAVCLAAVRSLGLNAAPVMAVRAESWSRNVVCESAFAGVLLLAEVEGEELILHPAHGVVSNPGDWGRHVLLSVNGNELREIAILSRGEGGLSVAEIGGSVTLAEDGSAEGELRVRLTGAFCASAELGSTEVQTKFADELTKRVLVGFAAGEMTVTRLSDRELSATIPVSTKDPLRGIVDDRLLELGDGPVLLESIALPLGGRDRTCDVLLPGALHETVDLTVKLPEAWSVRVLPRPVSAVDEDWGTLDQIVALEDGRIRIKRALTVRRARLEASSYAGLREAVNLLRADGYRCLIVGQSKSAG